MYIAVTGFFGAGSSAVLDLLFEYDNNGNYVANKEGGYEHTCFYHPGGLFDLEDKLLLGNDIHRSDEAIKTFIHQMKNLEKNNYGWLGSYKEMFGDVFAKNVEGFLDELKLYKSHSRYYGQLKAVRFNPIKVLIQFAAKILTGRKIYVWGREFVYDTRKPCMITTFPYTNEFYSAAHKFVYAYMEMFRIEDKNNVVFDRILSRHNLYRIPRYFDDDFKVVVIERDIRDIYVLNKYLWREMNAGSMYPLELEEFCDYWERIHKTERLIDDNRIIRIKFEDLIYFYDETVERIEKHCDLKKNEHSLKGHYFQPERSIKNTQAYRLREEWKAEINYLEERFPQYCYEFPYENKTNVEDMFDDSRAEKSSGGLKRILRLIK